MTGTEKAKEGRRSRYAAVKLVKPSEPSSVPMLRHRAAAFASHYGLSAELTADIALAVSEAVTNTVKYAYGPEGEGPVELSVAAEDGWLEIRITDEGKGFGKGSSDGLGLGLTIIARLCDDLKIVQEGTGTQVLMRFALPDR